MNLFQKHARLWIFLPLVALAVVLNGMFGWSAALAKPENLSALRRMVAENLPLALLAYVALTVVGCVVLALPGVVFAITAGALFGPWWGTLACSVATTLGACLAFWAGRYFLRGSVKPLLMKNKHLRRVLLEESGKHDVFLLALTRLVPIFPFNLQNFAYGVTNIGFWPYAWYSFAFMLPGTAAYVFAAAGLSDSRGRLLYFAVALVLFLILGLASGLLKKRQG
jgi:uncharacterized membrane protein YdjX (TVP38/TMEM64 family)